MTEQKSVLVVGLDPALIDFSQPGYPPGMSIAKVLAGMKSSEDELTRLGYGRSNVPNRLWRHCGGSGSDPTEAEAFRLCPHRGRCKNEPESLDAV